MNAREDGGVKASERLKKDTLQVHKKLESLVFPLLLETPSLESYATYLECLRELYLLWEPKLLSYASRDPWLCRMEYQKRLRLQHLEDDLEELGAKGGPSGFLHFAFLKNRPMGQLLPSIETPSSRLGLLYVVEGSVLGGAVIARRIRDALGEGMQLSYRFLTHYGQETLPMWNLFKDVLDSYHGRYPDAYPSMAEAARQTFELFVLQFQGFGSPRERQRTLRFGEEGIF